MSLIDIAQRVFALAPFITVAIVFYATRTRSPLAHPLQGSSKVTAEGAGVSHHRFGVDHVAR